jgi:hypothetical protein
MPLCCCRVPDRRARTELRYRSTEGRELIGRWIPRIRVDPSFSRLRSKAQRQPASPPALNTVHPALPRHPADLHGSSESGGGGPGADVPSLGAFGKPGVATYSGGARARKVRTKPMAICCRSARNSAARAPAPLTSSAAFDRRAPLFPRSRRIALRLGSHLGACSRCFVRAEGSPTPTIC